MAEITRKASDNIHVQQIGRGFVAEIPVSLAETPAEDDDTMKAWKISAGTRIQACAVLVKTAEGQACTVAVGDSDDDDGFGAAYNLNALGIEAKDDAAYPSAGGKTYTSDDHIILTFSKGEKAEFSVIVYGFMPAKTS